MRTTIEVKWYNQEMMEEMRKEADEDEGFYDRTAELQGPKKDEQEDAQFRERAKGQSYEELKRSLEGLLAEKADANEQLANIAQEERKAAVDSQNMEELDRLIQEDAKVLRKEKRQTLVERMKTLVEQIDK